MENQNNNLQELEELRSQVAEFKNRMEEQEIVSRQLLSEAMNGHVSWIKRMTFWGSVVELALLPLIAFVLKNIIGVSWLPTIFIVLVGVGEAIFNFWNISTIRDKYLAANDVLSAQQRLMAYKRREKIYTFSAFPLLLLWIVWILLDIHSSGIPIPSDPNRLVIDFVVIFIIFASFFYVFSLEMRSLNKAIKEIDEFGKSSA